MSNFHPFIEQFFSISIFNFSQKGVKNQCFGTPRFAKTWKRRNFFCLCNVPALTSAQSFGKGTKSSGKFQ